MIAKVIVWDETRARAIEKMKLTLKDTIVFGVKTNIPYLLKILEHPDFVAATMTTQFINSHFADGLEDVGLTNAEAAAVEQLFGQTSEDISGGDPNREGPSPWRYDWGNR